MSKLKLSDWANLAEVMGAVAVVVSLIYVGVQINENTIEVREANRQVFVDRSFIATGRVAVSSELAGAFAKVTEGTELTAAESFQYSFFVRGLLYDIQEAFLLHNEGRLSDEYWETRRAIFVWYMNLEPAVAVYRRDKSLGVLHSDFIIWADQVIHELGNE